MTSDVIDSGDLHNDITRYRTQ